MMFHVVLHPEEDGWIVAECPALPGCVSQGKDEKGSPRQHPRSNHGLALGRRSEGNRCFTLRPVSPASRCLETIPIPQLPPCFPRQVLLRLWCN
jgi:hypothetical protein